MSVLSEEAIVEGFLLAHVSVSTITSSLLTMYAVSVYLFSVALLLVAAIILFIIHWRYQIVNSRTRRRSNDLCSPDSPLMQHLYQNCQLKELQDRVSSVESLEGSDRYSQYDNSLPNNYEKNYEPKYLKKTGII